MFDILVPFFLEKKHPKKYNISGYQVDMKRKNLTAVLLIFLMFGVTTSTYSQSLSDEIPSMNSHTQNVPNNWEWSSVLMNSGDIVSDDIGIDNQGNYYIIGTLEGLPNIKDSSVFVSHMYQNGKNLFVAKYDSTGSLQWLADAGGNGDDYGKGIIVDEDSNGNVLIFVTGELETREVTSNQALISHDIHFGEQLSYTISQGYVSPFVAKISPLGVWQWAVIGQGHQLVADVNDITFDGVNSIYIGGRFSNYLNFTSTDKTGVEITKSAATGCSQTDKMGFIGAFTTSGQHRDTQTTNGCGTWITSVEVRSSSNVFVSGGFWMSNTVGSTTFVIPSDPLGAPHGNGYYFNTNGDVDKHGNLIGTWSPALEEAFLAALNPVNMNWEWERRITGMNRERVNEIVVDSNHDAIIGGNFMANISFEDPLKDCSLGGADYPCIGLKSTGDFDMFIAKISSEGDWIYADSNAGMAIYAPISATDFLQSLVIDQYDNLYVMGSFLNNLDVGIDHLHATPYYPLYFVAKYTTSDTNHDWVWGCQADRVPGHGSEVFTGWGLSRYNGIVIDSQGLPVISGFFADSVRFDEDYLSNNENGQHLKAAYIAKLSDSCADPLPVPENIKVGDISRDTVTLLNSYTEHYGGAVADLDTDMKSIIVSVKPSCNKSIFLQHDEPESVRCDLTATKHTIVSNTMDIIAEQKIRDASKHGDDFTDIELKLISHSDSCEDGCSDNFTYGASVVKSLLAEGIIVLEETEGDTDGDTDARAKRKPIKGYVYIRRSRRMAACCEPEYSPVVAWGIRADASGGYLVDELASSLENIESEYSTTISNENISDVCDILHNKLESITIEDACMSVIAVDTEDKYSDDGKYVCSILPKEEKRDEFLNHDNDSSLRLTIVEKVGGYNNYCGLDDSGLEDNEQEPDRSTQNSSCSLNVLSTNVTVGTDMFFYQVGDDVDVTYYINCEVESINYTIKATLIRSNGEVVDVYESNWIASGVSSSPLVYLEFDETYSNLDVDAYCITAELSEPNNPLLDDDSTCFIVSSSSSTGGGSTPSISLIACLGVILFAARFRRE